MPPKAASPKGKEKNADSQEGETHTINPNVLLYLQAATRAFPKVESSLLQYSKECDASAEETKRQLESKTINVDESVHGFKGERTTLEGALGDLDKYLNDTKSKISAGIRDYDLTKAEEERLGDELVAVKEKEIDDLEDKQRQSDEWIQEAQRRKTELKGLEDQIAAMEKKHEQSIQELKEKALAQQRKLRDSLVRKLRRARDQLTSTTDDDSDVVPGKGASDETLLLSFGNSIVPSAKQNEKLSREVTTYEYDCESIETQNKTLRKDEFQLQTALRSERAGNEVLVTKNASHFKAKKILSAQLAEVQSQFVGAMDHHHTQHQDRLGALRETVTSQDTLIDDLQRELELAFTEYDDTNHRLQLRTAELGKHEEQEKLALRFLLNCQATPETPVPDGGGGQDKSSIVAQLGAYFAKPVV